jgi:hypothetical protein
MSVPVPSLVSEPPVAGTSQPTPQSLMTPLKTVERLLPPTARFLLPSQTLPLPSIDPTLVPADWRPEMSRTPLPLRTKRAVPPLAKARNWVLAPELVMIVAAPAVLFSPNPRERLFVMVAFPAVLVPKKVMRKLLVIVALPAVLCSTNCTPALFVILELAALLVSLNVTLSLLVMVALPAMLESTKSILALLMMVALPALLVSLNIRMSLFVMVALPAVLLLSKVTPPLFVIVALPAVLLFSKDKDPLFIIAALPAVLASRKERLPPTEGESGLFVIVALPAELALPNSKVAVFVIVALPPFTTIPAPFKLNRESDWLLNVKFCASELSVHPPTVPPNNVVILRLEFPLPPKNAVPVGTLLVLQLVGVV